MKETEDPFAPDSTNHAIIGIDPGVKTGIALWRPKYKDFEAIMTMKIHDAMAFVKVIAEQTNEEKAMIEVRCEDPNTFVPFYKDQQRARAAIQGAGSIKRDFKIWRDYCESLHIVFLSVSLHKVQKKTDPALFKKITGWEGRTSEHARDAAMLVYNSNLSF